MSLWDLCIVDNIQGINSQRDEDIALLLQRQSSVVYAPPQQYEETASELESPTYGEVKRVRYDTERPTGTIRAHDGDWIWSLWEPVCVVISLMEISKVGKRFSYYGSSVREGDQGTFPTEMGLCHMYNTRIQMYTIVLYTAPQGKFLTHKHRISINRLESTQIEFPLTSAEADNPFTFPVTT